MPADALRALEPVLGRPDGAPVPLDGGITNRNFRVSWGGRDCVLRVPGANTELLGIDRVTERLATGAAAAAGIGPEVVAHEPRGESLVTAFIEGRPVEPEELRSDLLAEAAAALRTIHTGPPLPTSFSAFGIVERYADTTLERGGALPPEYADLLAGAREIQDALRGPEHVPVPCHNDLLTANFLHDGGRLRILDWEYAAMGDRYFDLGNLSVNNGFGEGDDKRLLAAYWGEPCTLRRFAALRLMRIMSDFREGMWGVVQLTISELDFDFAGYAGEHLGRVRAGLEDPRCAQWLRDARGD